MKRLGALNNAIKKSSSHKRREPLIKFNWNLFLTSSIVFFLLFLTIIGRDKSGIRHNAALFTWESHPGREMRRLNYPLEPIANEYRYYSDLNCLRSFVD